MNEVTIRESMDCFISEEKNRHSKNTVRAYTSGCKLYLITLEKAGINPSVTKVAFAQVEWVKFFISDLTNLAPKSAHLYISAIKQWFSYINDVYGVNIDEGRLKSIITEYSPKDVALSPTDPDFGVIQRIINHVSSKDIISLPQGDIRLRFLRDRAIILALADTGIGAETLCTLNNEDFDRKNKRIILGKRRNKITIDLSKRAMLAITEYLRERNESNGLSTTNVKETPLFARFC